MKFRQILPTWAYLESSNGASYHERYLKRNPVIPQAAGLSRLDAEVLAANEMLNLFPKAILKDIAAATYRIKGDKTSQGNSFAAC